jgi:integrase
VTSDALVKAPATSIVGYSPEERQRTDANKRKGLADGTRKGYAVDWRRFEEFCARRGESLLPTTEDAICAHLTELAATGEFKIGTLRHVYTSIRAMHTHAGQTLPRFIPVEHTLSNLAKQLGGRARQAAPFTLEDLRRFVSLARRGVAGVRDRALVLLGFAAALRRSELVALDAGDLEFESDGLRALIRRSKTDQEGAGQTIGVNFGEGSLCPVEATRAWLDSSGIEVGPVFRSIDRHGHLSAKRLSAKHVDRLAKQVAVAIGKNPARYSGHSFRAGLATSAAAAGKGLDEIMRTTRHESEKVARGYIRDGQIYTRSANRGLMK